MHYREFGNTGVRISALGFGAMRLPMSGAEGDRHVDENRAIEVIHRAFELGVNYIDSAYGYCNGESEVVVGKALKGWREKVYVSTKLPVGRVQEKADYRRLLEEQLRKLDTDYIDFYHFHGLRRRVFIDKVKPFDLIGEARRAREEGLIRHISFSFHDKPEVLKEFADLGVFDSVLCQYNLLDRTNEDAITHARGKGLGTVVMGPVGGGRLGFPSEVISSVTAESVGRDIRSTAELALRFVLAHPDVCCALSGMSTIEMVEENCATASQTDSLSPAEIDAVNAAMKKTKKLADLYCTGCKYCMPCPHNVNIARIFQLVNYYRVYDLKQYAVNAFKNLRKEQRPENCVECGACEKKCPQNIHIRQQLKEALEILA